MTNQSFNLGDVVQLKSGGPAMTVTHVSTNSRDEPAAWCEWFTGHEPKSASFAMASLRTYVKPNGMIGG